MIMQFHKSGYYHQHDKDFRIERPDGSGDYLLLLVRTAGWFRIHGTDYHTSPNTILLYKKGTPQLYRACEAIYSDDWLHFHMDESDLLFVSKLEIPFDTPVQVHDIHDLSLLIKDITYEHYSDNIHKEETLLLYLQILLLKISEKLHKDTHHPDNIYYDKLSNLRSQIYNMPYKDWDMESISASMSLSKYYFQHLYKNTFGVTAMQDIIQSRTDHARYLLSTTRISIHEVGQMCGYNSDTHFIRQFKGQTGVTPSEYRSTLQ